MSDITHQPKAIPQHPEAEIQFSSAPAIDLFAGAGNAAGKEIATIKRSYTADLIPDPENFTAPIDFDVTFDPSNKDEPWAVASDVGADTHHTLDEALFWNLIIGERHISEGMRASINAEFAGLVEQD